MTDKLVCPLCKKNPWEGTMGIANKPTLACRQYQDHDFLISGDTIEEARNRWLQAFAKKEGE